jgi:hypothetical protein
LPLSGKGASVAASYVGQGVKAGVAVSAAVALAVALGGMGLDVCVLGMMTVLVETGSAGDWEQEERSKAIANTAIG